MRTIVDIPDDNIKTLDIIAKHKDVSRAELVRRAVADYLEKENTPKPMSTELFGSMKDVYTEDSLIIEQRLRSEWDDREEMYGNWGMQEPKAPPYDAGTTKNKDKKS